MSGGLERSPAGLEPVEVFEFARGTTRWRYTSADEPILYLGATYEPRAGLSRGEISHTQEQSTGSVEIRLPRTDPVAALFIGPLPPAEVAIRILRLQRRDLQRELLFVGTVLAARFAGAIATLTCAPVEALLGRNAPGLVYQPQCNWILYGSGCQVDPAPFRDAVTVSSVAGLVVTIARAAGPRPDGWYRRGWLETAAGERRSIVAQVGNRLEVNAAFRSLAAGDAVTAIAGCEHTEADCQNKFDNLDRFMGFPRVPARNPFTGTA